MTIPEGARIERTQSVLFSDLEGSTVMMDIDSGNYYELDKTSARIWSLLEAPQTLAELCRSLEREFEVDDETCRGDTSAFLLKLSELGLVTISQP